MNGQIIEVDGKQITMQELCVLQEELKKQKKVLREIAPGKYQSKMILKG